MPKKSADSGDVPKKLSNYTVKLSELQIAQLRSICESRGWEQKSVEYTHFAFKAPTCNITAYTSGKVVIAGKGTEEFVQHTLEPEVTGQATLGYDEVNHPDWFEGHGGLDESGKGDLFGPVIAATVIADPAAIESWIKAGVRDSKKVGDPQILRLDHIIRETKGVEVRTCFCGMAKYNELMARPRANLNRLLAWQHAIALDQALARKPTPWALLDQFTKEPLVQKELVRRGRTDFDLRMRTKAEEDPVVAAASIVARAEYVRFMKKLSDESGETLLKGAGSGVKAQAIALVQKHGVGILPKIAKLHFRTSYEVVVATGKLAELPLKPPPEKTAWKR